MSIFAGFPSENLKRIFAAEEIISSSYLMCTKLANPGKDCYIVVVKFSK